MFGGTSDANLTLNHNSVQLKQQKSLNYEQLEDDDDFVDNRPTHRGFISHVDLSTAVSSNSLP